MIKKVLNFVRENRIIENGDSVVLGVSGGADSICMLSVLNELKEQLELTLTVVHVNHHIRGKEAERDADFVKMMCDSMEITCVRVDKDIPSMAKKTGMSEEEAGRHARYEAFNDVVESVKANKIAVAHNLNDNSETVLFNLFRGTGIKGLTGIPCKREMIIRPLLCCTRQEIESYLNERGLEFCMDSTNKTTEYSRNKIRLELLPYIKENINNKAEYNIVNAAENLGEIYDFINMETEKAYNKYVSGNVFLQDGFNIHPALQNHIIRKIIEDQAGKLKDITKNHVTSVMSLRNMNTSKSVNLPYGLVAKRTYDGIVIKKNQEIYAKKNVCEKIIENGHIFEYDKLNIALEKDTFDRGNIEELVYTKWLDYDKIQGLTLRNRQEGDYIVIDEKGSQKKLKDYFINEKIPREKRDDILLLADGSHIVWIIGYRISSYYKVSESTSQIIKVTYGE